MIKDKSFVSLVLFGLATRLSLINLPGFAIDINDWAAWATRLSQVGFKNFYSKDVFTDYTPGYLYILSFLDFLKNIFKLNINSFYLLLKIPAILCEVIVAILIYRELIKSTSRKISLITVGLILFNPALIFNSSIWGQIDSVLSLVMLISILFLINKRIIMSSVFFGLSLLIKPQALAILPIFILFLVKNFSFSNLLKLSLPFILVIYFLSLPFFPNQTIVNFSQHIFNSANTYPFNSLFAYNLWGVIGFWISDSQIWNTFSLQKWGYIIFATYWIIISFFFIKKRIPIYTLAVLATLSFYFLLTRVHERYLYPAIPLLILVSALLKSKLLISLTIILSFLYFLNMYFVYVYYNEIYLNLPKILYNPTIYNLLTNNGKTLSFISTSVFILVSIILVRLNYVKNKIKS